MAVGMTFVIITGGIDLSVASILALSSIVAAYFAKMPNTGFFIPLLMATISGGLCGLLFNGVIIAYGKMAPFIATLAGMSVFRGITLIVTEATPIFGFNDTFLSIGHGVFLGIPYIVLIFIGVLIIAFIFQRTTVLARYLFVLGDNKEAARLAGLPTNKLLLFVYTLSGLCSGLAGGVLSARIASGEPTVGVGYELYAIAAVIIGGNSLFGGSGGVHKTIIGILIAGVIDNGLNLLLVPSYYQYVSRGAVIVFAVLFDQFRTSKETK